jgi:small subunit ribosomal protein S1
LTEIKNTSVIEFEDVSDEQMNAMIDGTLTSFDEGDLVNGTIVKIEHDEVLVDIGFKSEGVIPARELSIRKDIDPASVVSLGDTIEALVLQKEDKDGRLVLSKRRAEYERAWNTVEEKYKAGELVTGEVIEVVKGGLILDIGLRGFLPASLVDLRRVKDLDSYLGTEIEARVIEMDRNRNNVVLSRRVILEEGRKNERAEILGQLKKGMRLKGTVSSIVDFGAFVDLGGIDGLVHISELSWNHVNHPSEVVKINQEVEVEVLDVDLSRERISLGLKQTTEDPWMKMVEAFPIGSIVEGKVTKLVPFGCFIELAEGIEGLVHISEIAAKHIDSPAQVVHQGDVVKVKVMEVNPERRRISLSMKAAAEELGIEIEIDESVVVEERPTRRKKEAQAEEAPAEEAAQEAVDEAPAEEAAEAAAEEVPVEEAPAEAAEEATEVAEASAEEAPTEEAPEEAAEE